MALYLMGYGVWRFILEYLRGDDRGETIVSFLTPSQLTAVLMIIVGVLLLVLKDRIYGTEKPARVADGPKDGGASE